MKVLHVHAHFDDYEFTAAGSFELWRRQLGAGSRARGIVRAHGPPGHPCPFNHLTLPPTFLSYAADGVAGGEAIHERK